jgi:hypothetical protein
METVKTVIKWFAAILTEPDHNGGKASFSRVAGAYVIISIVSTAQTGGNPHEMLWDMFMVLIGYQLLSKTLSSFTPAVLDFAKGYLSRYSQKTGPAV